MLLLSALIAGSGSVWADEVAYTFATAKSTSNTAYASNYTVTIDGLKWSVPGNQNNTGYVRIGGKEISKVDRNIIGLDAISSAISKITVNHNGKSNNNFTVHSVTITVASDKDFNSVIQTTTLNPTISTSTSGTFDFEPTSDTWDANSYYKFTFNVSNSNKTNYGIDIASIVFYTPSGGGGTATTTAVFAPDGFVTDLNGNTGVSAGTLTATVTPEGESALASPAITWSSDNTSVATVNASTGAVTLWAVGSANIKASYAGDEDYQGSNGSYALTVTNSNPGDGSLAKPYTVAEALALISGYSSNSGSASSVYTKGIVSSVVSLYNSTMLVYYISIDGTGSNTLQVFRGKNVGNTNFSAVSDLTAGDEVVIYGQLYKYGSTPEINTGNYIYSLNGKIKPTITFGEDSYEVAYNGSLTISATSTSSGTITYSSSDTDIAEINASTGEVTPHTQGEVTIRATIAESSDNIEWYEEVTLTVTDGRAAAGIEFAQTSITTTWGESYTGQALTNPNGLTVSYESTVPAVATVDAGTGEVTIVKAGTTIIKANYAGDSSYMPAEVSYTLTVNKAAAGLSFDETEFNIELDDDSFVAPTLNNPNGLTVTYESSDEDIALVDDNTGEIVLETSAEGSVTITASFAGNDWYNAGNASYTINIYDPNAKGTKNNPYTVAEVNTGSYSGNNYVIGYIVGYFNGSASDATTTGTSNTVSNVALSDSPSEIGGANTIAIQLPSGEIRNAWNIYDNAVIGYKVLVYGNITGYFTNKTGVKSTSEITAVSVPAEVTAAGYATFVAKAAVDFTESNIKAYVAEPNGTTGVTFTRVGKIPANTGVLLYKDGGATEEIPVTTETGLYVGNNVFVPGEGVAVASVDPDNSNLHNYILNNGTSGIGFYRANDKKVAKNRAYIQIDESTLVKEFISLPGFDDDDATGIRTIDNGQLTIDNEIYNLAGQRLNKIQKGINIVNGKKILK